MAEKKMKITLDKIEKLIVDGQTELLGEIVKLKTGQQEIRREIQEVERNLGDKIDKIDKQEAVNATAAYDLLTDIRKEVEEVKEKLDVHIRVPHVV